MSARPLTPRRVRPSRTAAVLGAVLVLLAAVSGCGLVPGAGERGPHDVLLWTQQTGTLEMDAQKAAVAAVQKRHPELHIELVGKPGAISGDETQLITAVRGGTAPDAILTSRFDLAQQAAIGLLRPLNAATTAYAHRTYLPFAVGEGTYRGRVYALPFDTDVRALYYNRTLFRRAGIDLADFDPRHGPPTLDQVMAAAKKLDRRDAHGNYTRLGIIPWDGEGSPTTWAMGRGATFFDSRTCRIDTSDPALRDTYRQIDAWGRQLDYPKVDVFKATYQPPNAPPSESPFATGRLGMSISGDWDVATYRDSAPKLDYGVTYLPVMHRGQQPYTWSGGYGWAMPRGSQNPTGAQTVLRELAGAGAQQTFASRTGHLPTRQDLLHGPSAMRFHGAEAFFAGLLRYSRARQAIPVASALWESLGAEQQAVLMRDSTPAQALDYLDHRVNSLLSEYCPFTLPHGGG